MMLNVTNLGSQQALRVPDRFESLRDAGSGALESIIVPVDDSLAVIDERFMEIAAAGRGGLMLLRGDSGAGKSTFLDTVHLFREGVSTRRLPADADVPSALAGLGVSSDPRIIVMEGREALGEVSASALEAAMHAINSFVRSERGHDSLIVWPTNTDDLTERLLALGRQLGSEALFGIGDSVIRFTGPRKRDFLGIAERTVGALNEGASLVALGISNEQAQLLADDAPTIGRYLAVIRQALLANGARIRKLLKSEQFRLWTIVIAGNDTEGDVAALTRGGFAYADIDRLITATGANVVKDLKKEPDTLGILGTVLDANILNLDMVTVLAVARAFGDADLHRLMRNVGMSTSPDSKAVSRLLASELGLISSGQSLGTRKRGSKPGSSTQSAFSNLATIARTNDGALNRAIGTAMVSAGVATSFETENQFGTQFRYVSDLLLQRPDGPVRLEVMWRSSAGRADIANYVLTKLNNYARAIGLVKL